MGQVAGASCPAPAPSEQIERPNRLREPCREVLLVFPYLSLLRSPHATWALSLASCLASCQLSRGN
jgi:hypothetical protein